LAFALFQNVLSFKVLGILPLGSKSHYAIGSSIVNALYEAGHELTVITPFSSDKPKKNYREISMAELLKKHEEEQSKKNIFNNIIFFSREPQKMKFLALEF
jgi:hypothetical protein